VGLVEGGRQGVLWFGKRGLKWSNGFDWFGMRKEPSYRVKSGYVQVKGSKIKG
jgi:hypothetical protein